MLFLIGGNHGIIIMNFCKVNVLSTMIKKLVDVLRTIPRCFPIVISIIILVRPQQNVHCQICLQTLNGKL